MAILLQLNSTIPPTLGDLLQNTSFIHSSLFQFGKTRKLYYHLLSSLKKRSILLPTSRWRTFTIYWLQISEKLNPVAVLPFKICMVTKQQKLASSGLFKSSLPAQSVKMNHHALYHLLSSSALQWWQGSWLSQSPMIIAYAGTSDCSESLEHARQIENFHHHFPKELQINWWPLSNSRVAFKTHAIRMQRI